MNGIETIEKIKKIDKFATIVMVSAVGQQMIMFEALFKGAKDFIRKPIMKDDVVHVLENILKKM